MAKVGKKASARDYSIILAPLITEKGNSGDKESGQVVAFRVHQDADKTEISAAVTRIFKVDVAAVRTLNVMGKPKKTARSSGRRAGYRKAYVRLKPGQSINVIEGV